MLRLAPVHLPRGNPCVRASSMVAGSLRTGCLFAQKRPENQTRSNHARSASAPPPRRRNARADVHAQAAADAPEAAECPAAHHDDARKQKPPPSTAERSAKASRPDGPQADRASHGPRRQAQGHPPLSPSAAKPPPSSQPVRLFSKRRPASSERGAQDLSSRKNSEEACRASRAGPARKDASGLSCRTSSEKVRRAFRARLAREGLPDLSPKESSGKTHRVEDTSRKVFFRPSPPSARNAARSPRR